MSSPTTSADATLCVKIASLKTTPVSSPMNRFLSALAFALALLVAGAAPAFSQASVDRPEMVRDLKIARKTVAEANRTASEMAAKMTSLKKKLERHLQKLGQLEKGTQAYTLTYERARAAHSKMMSIRKEMLDKQMAAYGSAIGSLNSALKTRKEGTGLAKDFENEVEKTRGEIEGAREKGEKIEAIRDYGNPDKAYRKVLDAQLRTLRHEIGVKKDYIKKLKANARKARKNSQNDLYDRLRTLKATLKRRRTEFKFEKKHLQNTARRLRQELRMRQKLTAFRQFYTEMRKISKVTKGLKEEIKSIYQGLGQAPSFSGSLPDPKALQSGGGSPVMEATSYEPVSSFKEGGS